ncbi:hypothetical protein DFH29DRAFT_367799 [Suillus ampliporus]|nr:hypothetical protein DFH29DRAFT_367799 [Suillus ampliporus]
MAPKLISISVFAIFLLACLSLLACAGPTRVAQVVSPIVTVIYKDAVAREALSEVEILKRVAQGAPELLALHGVAGVSGRDEPSAKPSVPVDSSGDGQEEFTCINSDGVVSVCGIPA